MKNPEKKVTIFTAPLSGITNMIYVSDTDFISLIEETNHNLIFEYIKTKSKGVEKFCFYILKEGFCLRTNGSYIENFQQFHETVKLASEKGFKYLEFYFHALELEIENGVDYHDFLASDFYREGDYSETNRDRFNEFIDARSNGFIHRDEYVSSKELGIQNYDNYVELIESGFTNRNHGNHQMKKDYTDFLQAKERGFSNKDDYELAEELGISEYQELELFMKSGFYEFNYYHNRDNYEEFKEARELGFYIKSRYDDAMALGFDNNEEYTKFLDSGCKTYDEYQFKIKFPPILKQISKKINEILLDANNAFKSMRYEEFFRLKYLSVEKMGEIAYMKIFKKEINRDNELKFDDIMISLNKKTDKELVDLKELKYWRRIRNKVIHEHFKLKKDDAMKGKEFLDELYNNLSIL